MIDSLHFVFARLLLPYIEPGPGAFYVMSFAALEVGILGLALGRLRLEPLLRLWPVFLAIGLCVAVSTNLNYAAIAYIDPGVASMVSKMQCLSACASACCGWASASAPPKCRHSYRPGRADGYLLSAGRLSWAWAR